jgi:hypothetical protein
MNEVFYIMEKVRWVYKTGGYDDVEVRTEPLTRKQVVGRFNRIKNASTLFLWTIEKYRKDPSLWSGRDLIGEINAEEFNGNDVPEWDD